MQSQDVMAESNLIFPNIVQSIPEWLTLLHFVLKFGMENSERVSSLS